MAFGAAGLPKRDLVSQSDPFLMVLKVRRCSCSCLGNLLQSRREGGVRMLRRSCGLHLRHPAVVLWGGASDSFEPQPPLVVPDVHPPPAAAPCRRRGGGRGLGARVQDRGA